MSILFNVCASKEELEDLEGMKVVNVSDYKNTEKNEGVFLEFEGEDGERILISIMNGTEINRSVKQRPLYCAQDIRDYEGYTIKTVQSDDDDLNTIVILENKEGHVIALYPDNAFDGETIFVSDPYSK